MATVVLDSIIAFLQRVPPFQFLEPADLELAASQAEVHYFPAGTRILQRDGPPPRYLYVVERGGVKRTLPTDQGAEALVEVLGEGEAFGGLPILEDRSSRFDVTALEDTVCYAVPRAIVEQLVARQPTFARYLLRASIQPFDWTLAEVQRGATAADAPGRVLYASPARDLARTRLITCSPDTTVQEAARAMSAQNLSAILLLGAAGELAGIVTDTDLRDRVVAAGRDLQTPVSAIASRPVIAIEADAPAAEAIRLMIERNINHLVVTDGGRPAALVTGHDVIVLQGTSALYIAREVDRQTDPAGLRRVVEQGQQVIPFLLRQGVRSGQLARLLAELNDRVVRRVLEFVEAELGPPPVPYCWLVLGSEGRREQTFKTDQDNGLLYADPDGAAAEAVRAYFLEFGRRAVAALVEAGFPPCKGHYTADNPLWTQPFRGWVQHFHRWIATPEPEAVLNSLIFFDFRAIHGDRELAGQLRDQIAALMRYNRLFLIHLAHLSTKQTPPIGFLGQFIVERSGEHRHELDLKLRGAGPVVDLARFFALQHGYAETNTLARLDLLRRDRHLSADLAEELGQAFEFILSLRIRRQWEQRQAGQELTNFINPQQLSSLERSQLREAFRVIARAQALVREEYYTEAIAT